MTVPFTPATDVEPPSTPPDDVADTVAVDVVGLPPASRIETTGWVVNTEPTVWAPVYAGWVITPSRAAVPEALFDTLFDNTDTAPTANLSL